MLEVHILGRHDGGGGTHEGVPESYAAASAECKETGGGPVGGGGMAIGPDGDEGGGGSRHWWGSWSFWRFGGGVSE